MSPFENPKNFERPSDASRETPEPEREHIERLPNWGAARAAELANLFVAIRQRTETDTERIERLVDVQPKEIADARKITNESESKIYGLIRILSKTERSPLAKLAAGIIASEAALGVPAAEFFAREKTAIVEHTTAKSVGISLPDGITVELPADSILLTGEIKPAAIHEKEKRDPVKELLWERLEDRLEAFDHWGNTKGVAAMENYEQAQLAIKTFIIENPQHQNQIASLMIEKFGGEFFYTNTDLFGKLDPDVFTKLADSPWGRLHPLDVVQLIEQFSITNLSVFDQFLQSPYPDIREIAATVIQAHPGILAELPPEEYKKLITQITASGAPLFASIIENGPALDQPMLTALIASGHTDLLKRYPNKFSQNDYEAAFQRVHETHDLVWKKLGENPPLSKKGLKNALEILDMTVQASTHGEIKKFIAIPEKKFLTIFTSSAFQEALKQKPNLTFANAASVAQAVYYRLEKRFTRSHARLRQITEAILEAREHIQNREILGPGTKLIIAAHEDKRLFDKDALLAIYRDAGGADENILTVAQGIEQGPQGTNINKRRILDAIRQSSGDTTVIFEGHGSPTNWAFANNEAYDQITKLSGDERSMNYRELGDALIASKNIQNINLIAHTCFSHDYIENLYRYLETKGVKERPAIAVSSSNRGKFTFSKIFRNAIKEKAEFNKPVTVETLFNTESDWNVWTHEDPSFFIPDPKSENHSMIIGRAEHGEKSETPA